LDWTNIKGDDFDNKVEPWLEEVADASEKWERLNTLKKHFLYEVDKIARQIQEEERNAPYHPYVDADLRSRRYIKQAQASRLELLTEMQ